MTTQTSKVGFLIPLFFVGVGLMCCAALIGAWQHVQQVAEGEKVSNALHLMAEVVAGSIRQTGRWPESAEDLNTAPAVVLAAYAWPRDREQLLQRVTVDYGLTSQDCRAFTAASFRAIRPLDDRFLDPYWQQHLLETIIGAFNSPADRHRTSDIP